MTVSSAQLPLNYLSLYSRGVSQNEFACSLSPKIKFKHFFPNQVYLAKDPAGVTTAFNRIFPDKSKIKIISSEVKKYDKTKKTFKIKLVYQEKLQETSRGKKYTSYKQKTYLTYFKTKENQYFVDSITTQVQKH